MHKKLRFTLAVMSLFVLFCAVEISTAKALTMDEFTAGQTEKSSCKNPASFFLLIENRPAIFTGALAAELEAAPIARRGFVGCWTYFPAGPCRAVYSSGQSYQICGKCDDYGNPGSGGCSNIGQRTLDTGYWCS